MTPSRFTISLTLVLLCLAPCMWAQTAEPIEDLEDTGGAPEVIGSEGPARPDLTELSPEEARAAMSKYIQEYKEWSARMSPIWEEETKRAIAVAEERAKERARQATEREKRIQAGEELPESISEPSAVTVPADYQWQKDARGQRLGEAVIAQLERDGLVIAGPDYDQSFSVYGDSSVIPFVTSDSILNGFHVLLETSLKKFELRRSGRLREMLEAFWRNLDRQLAEKKVPRKLVEPYIRHLALVTGPALRLLGSTIPLGDAVLEAEIEEEVGKITKAQAVGLPKWLGPAEPGLLAIDFRRCRPLGFYTDSPTLSNYYRTVRWLQLVPFRASRDNETGAAALLAEIAGRTPSGLREYVEQGEKIWGEEDGSTVSQMVNGGYGYLAQISQDGHAGNALQASGERIRNIAKYSRPRIHDRLRTTNDSPTDASVQILAGSVLPDALFLESIAEKRPAEKTMPQGLEVAAWLGSDFAISLLGPAEWKRLIARRESENEIFQPMDTGWDSIPEGYYEVLKSLFQPSDPAAPAFMNSEAWQRKSVQTALAGWAQLRHAWELQTKLTISTVGGSRRPSGFIEPNPVFFQRMSQLESVLVARLQKAGVFADAPADEIEFLRGELKKLERIGFGKIAVAKEDLFDPEYDRIFEIPEYAQQMDASIDPGQWDKLEGEEQVKYWQRVIQVLWDRIARMERGEGVPELHSRTYKYDGDRQLFARWQELQTLTGRLEAMVQKQLRGADWNENEAELLKHFQESLGVVMGYFASASHMPKDDAPRWTTVHFDPNANRNLAVAIGRPRALYVLYPWKGQSILCRGAVMTYYEYASEKRLTDLEWKQLLDRPGAPEQPEWIRPVTVEVSKQ